MNGYLKWLYAHKILAKDDGETLAQHTMHCLEVAKSVVKNLPFDEPFLASINADLQDALAVHDAGKAATGFQASLIPNSKRWGKRHEIISGSFASFQKLREEVVFAVLTHHKTIPGDGVHNSKGCLIFEDLPFDSNSVWLKTAKDGKLISLLLLLNGTKYWIVLRAKILTLM